MSSLSPDLLVEHAEFTTDAILFDMDGTLVDSIAAVEQAWGDVALGLGKSPEEVIAATHGKRAIDNLRELRPALRRLTDDQMGVHVEEFEKKILSNADEFGTKVRSRRGSSAGSSRRGSNAASLRASSSSGINPLLAGGLFGLSKIATPGSDGSGGGGAADADQISQISKKLSELKAASQNENPFDDDDDEEEEEMAEYDFSDYTEAEIGCKDRSVKILPSVARFIASLPIDRYAVATSGAKTYCHGALLRAGIRRPAVTITADDPRLKRGKPFPDPFILAATELGYDVNRCVVFEDSPSGIIAGVASGAIVIAVCTSHPHDKISHVGAHYIVPSMDHVFATVNKDGTIRIVIDAHPPDHPHHGRIKKTPAAIDATKEVVASA